MTVLTAGVIQDETQRHIRQRHARGDERLQRVGMLNDRP